VEQAVACMQTVHFLGVPEGDQALAQATLYLALAAKSDAAYSALNAVRSVIQSAVAQPVPLHLRNAPTRLMKELGYSEGYRHAHQFTDAVTGMECLPDSLAGQEFYHPTNRGLEAKIVERLQRIREAKREWSNPTDETGVPDPS
jgi:putative ATPase